MRRWKTLLEDASFGSIRMSQPVVLIIRDGWGVSASGSEGAVREGNSVLLAKTPVHDELLATYPWNLLQSSGAAVGLPDGQMGNSEVGHLNIGAGRIVPQEVMRISNSIDDGSFFEKQVLIDQFQNVRDSHQNLHLIGLCSDGGVHSHLDHLFALLDLAKRVGVVNVFVHAITDGRDTSPDSGLSFVRTIERYLKDSGVGQIATIIGRYYAMDRDLRWDRIEKAYRAIVYGEGERGIHAVNAIKEWYDEGITDEFIPPTVIGSESRQSNDAMILQGDAVVCFNFRADRARQLTEALTARKFTGFIRPLPPDLQFVSMTEYKEGTGLDVVFPPDHPDEVLSQIVSAAGLRQFKITETEKYPHVTYFLNGGIEQPFEGEDRFMVPSPGVATYDLQPEMSAKAVTQELISRLRTEQYQLVVVNYANLDMVGHTGDLEAAIQATETVDSCLGDVIPEILATGGVGLITSDHGNAEKMLTERGGPFTAHTTNPVEFVMVSDRMRSRSVFTGKLADIAPTILNLMELPQSELMTGINLLGK